MTALNDAPTDISALMGKAPRGQRLFGSWPKLIGIAVVLLAVVVLWQRQTASPVVQYDTEPVVRRALENTVTASGRIEPSAHVDVGAQVSGQLRVLHVEAGDQVQVGQVLAEIDAEVQAAQVEGLEAELSRLAAERAELQISFAFAERHAGRQTSLAGRASSRVALEEAERDRDLLASRIDAIDATIRRSRAELRAESATLARARITSPMAGTVVALEARVGQTLNANNETPVLLRIADLSLMTVRSEVSEADVVQLRQGMPVWFTTLGFPDRRFRATLRQVLPAPPETDGDSGTKSVVSYVALFDIANPGGELLSGMTAQVFFVTDSSDDALVIPVSAMNDDGTVRVRDEGGRLDIRTPTTGLRTRSHIEITSGLAAGEQVVTGERSATGQSLLRIAP